MMPIQPKKSLHDLINELKKWQAEDRLVSAALLVTAAEYGAAFFAKGELIDASESRVQIIGWGRAAIALSGGIIQALVAASTKEAVEQLNGGSPIHWPDATVLEFSNGNVLAFWSSAQTSGERG